MKMRKIDDIIDEIRKKTEIQTILEKYSLSRILLYNIMLQAKKGKSNIEIARTLGVHSITLKRYSNKYKSMKESEVVKIKNFFYPE